MSDSLEIFMKIFNFSANSSIKQFRKRKNNFEYLGTEWKNYVKFIEFLAQK